MRLCPADPGNPRCYIEGESPHFWRGDIQSKQAILEAFNALGGVEYLCAVAREDPKAFCALLGKLIPAKVAGDEDNLWWFTPRSTPHPTKPESSGLPGPQENVDFRPQL